MTASHTPGPWVFTDGENPVDFATYDSPGYYRNICLEGPNKAFIVGCDEYDVWGYDDSRDANARLIAAAPDLLAALMALRERVGEAFNNPLADAAYNAATAAIAKATGEQT